MDKERMMREDDWDDEHASGAEKARIIKEEDEEEYYDTNKRKMCHPDVPKISRPSLKPANVLQNYSL